MNSRSRRARLDDIAAVRDSLHASPIEAPDFTSSILDRVDVSRPFLAPSVRRKMPWIRIGLAATVAMASLGVALTYRWAPGVAQLAGEPAPISSVVREIECVVCRDLSTLRPAVLEVGRRDASEFLAAVVAAARVSEGEGAPGDAAPAPTAVASLLPQSRAIAAQALSPRSSSAARSSMHTPARAYRVLSTAQSVLPESGGPAMLMAAEMPVGAGRARPGGLLESELGAYELAR